eukprot:181897-Prymnesium_polylepis.2
MPFTSAGTPGDGTRSSRQICSHELGPAIKALLLARTNTRPARTCDSAKVLARAGDAEDVDHEGDCEMAGDSG